MPTECEQAEAEFLHEVFILTDDLTYSPEIELFSSSAWNEWPQWAISACAEAALACPEILHASAMAVLWEKAVQSTATMDSPGRWVLMNGGPKEVARMLIAAVFDEPGIGNAHHWYECRCDDCDNDLYPTQILIAEDTADRLATLRNTTIKQRKREADEANSERSERAAPQYLQVHAGA